MSQATNSGLLHVITDFKVIGNVKTNLNLDKLCLLQEPLEKWHAYAHFLTPYLEAEAQTSPLHYRSYERNYFMGFRDRLLAAQDLDDVARCVDDTLKFAVQTFERGFEGATEKMRKMGGIRFRKGVRFLIDQARNHDLVLYPAGFMNQRCVSWIGGQAAVSQYKQHRDLREAVAGLTVGRVSVMNELLVMNHFEKVIGFTQFASTADLTESFLCQFWAWMDGDYRSTFSSKKTGGSTAFHRTRGLLNKIFEALFTHQKKIDASFEAPHFNARYFNRVVKNERSVTAHSYWWVVDGPEGRPELKLWGEALSWWVNHKPYKNPEFLVGSSKPLISYLNSLQNPPLSPSDFTRSYVVRRLDSPEQTYIEFLHKKGYAGRQAGYNALNDMRRFFDQWYDEFGLDVPNWQPPIKEHDIDSDWFVTSGKTNKEVLPIRIIKMMKAVIIENDFAWPKSLDEDYFDFYDGPQDRYVKVWSPVRAISLFTMLVIPIRSIQMRLLDSGEADEMGYDRANETWVKNAHPLAREGRQEGFWKKLYDHGSQQHFVGIHVTTNKTVAVTSAEFEVGYDIPWDCKELAPHIDSLIEWQKTYNPVTRLMTRRDCADKMLKPNDAIKQLPGYTFLFRDRATATGKYEPVSYARTRLFFLKCLKEVERRLRVMGEDVQLVEPRAEGNGSMTSDYTLHGLRAAGITHFVKAGVPIQVIAEFVSGHATILMTLYYAKFGPAYITDVLDQAQAAIDEGCEEEYLIFLKEAGADRLSDFVVSNDEAGLKWLADSNPGLWSLGIDGICPTGRAMCDEGGERLSAQNNPYYAPVPGGARNCCLCRFFITGPDFLNGQVVAFNNLLFAIGEKAKDLNRIKAKVAAAEVAGKSSRQVERERNHVDAVEKEIDLMLKALQAWFALIEKSRQKQRDIERQMAEATASQGAEPKHQLLTRMSTQEDLRIVLEHTSEFDLVDFVAHSCELFPEKAEPSARLRKGKILDQFMKRNGYEALFYQLPDDEALAAGNRLTRFLQQKVGRDRLRSLMDGHDTLKSLGIAQDFDSEAGLLLKSKPLAIELQRGIEAQ